MNAESADPAVCQRRVRVGLRGILQGVERIAIVNDPDPYLVIVRLDRDCHVVIEVVAVGVVDHVGAQFIEDQPDLELDVRLPALGAGNLVHGGLDLLQFLDGRPDDQGRAGCHTITPNGRE